MTVLESSVRCVMCCTQELVNSDNIVPLMVCGVWAGVLAAMYGWSVRHRAVRLRRVLGRYAVHGALNKRPDLAIVAEDVVEPRTSRHTRVDDDDDNERRSVAAVKPMQRAVDATPSVDGMPAFSVLFSDVDVAAERQQEGDGARASDDVIPAGTAAFADRTRRVNSMRNGAASPTASGGASRSSRRRDAPNDDGMAVMVRCAVGAAATAARNSATANRASVWRRGSIALSEWFSTVDAVSSKSGAGSVSGMPGQIFRQVRCIFVDMVRRNHVLFSVFAAPQDALLHFGVPERVMVLAAILFTSMCVSAMVCGRRPDAVQSRVITGMLAAVCMVPCRLLLPLLYRSATQLPAWRIERRVSSSSSSSTARRASRRQSRSRLVMQLRTMCCCCCSSARQKNAVVEPPLWSVSPTKTVTADASVAARRRLSGVMPQPCDESGGAGSESPFVTVAARVQSPRSGGRARVTQAAAGSARETYGPSDSKRASRRVDAAAVLRLTAHAGADADQNSESFIALPVGAGTLQRMVSLRDGDWEAVSDDGTAAMVAEQTIAAVGAAPHVRAVVSKDEGSARREARGCASGVGSGGGRVEERASVSGVDVDMWMPRPLASTRQCTSAMFLTEAERVLVAASLEETGTVEEVNAGEDAPLVNSAANNNHARSQSGSRPRSQSHSQSQARSSIAASDSATVPVQRCMFVPRAVPVFVALLNAQMLVRGCVFVLLES
jgi:hypothetical protein